MTIHLCKFCNYSTTILPVYKKHIATQKHKNNIKNMNNMNNMNETTIVTKKDITTIIKQNEDLKKEIIKLKQASNENTQIIVKEARVIKKSLLSILNSNYKDTPSIDYIKEDVFKTEFEEEFKYKIDDKENRLFMRIFSDFQKRKLINSLCNIIIKIIKKEDHTQQSVFNTDAARGNYATKIQDIWHNDKKGLQLKKYTVDVVTKYMIDMMEIYRERLIEMYNENKIKKDIKITDYIMEKQGILFEINAFLTNPNTHKRIILNMSPELRLDDKYLE